MSDKWTIQICFHGSAMWLESSTEPKAHYHEDCVWLDNITTDDLFSIAWYNAIAFKVSKIQAPKWTD